MIRAMRSDPYERYSRHYDAIGLSGFLQRSIANVLRYLGDRGFRPRSALDLACGTGAVVADLAARGIRVAGLDRSAAMIALATQRVAETGLSAEFIEADMTDFVVAAPVDLCTCFYDAVNYLTTLPDLGRFLRCAYVALEPGGYLAFDVNTIRKLSEGWDDFMVVAADDADRFLVYRSYWDESTANSPLQVTGFERRADGAWERFDEEHIEHGFAIRDIEQALDVAGFDDVRVLRWGEGGAGSVESGSEADFRVLFVARRPETRSNEL